MRALSIASLSLAAFMALGAASASAGCVNKGSVATAGSAKDAKWYAMETMVQAVSWSLWPGWLQNGKVAGYSISNERYRCNPEGGQVTCHGRATFCTKG
ncbi:MAG: hypothetical protein ABL907_13280 [Hyphomicrobium sp.]